jgi:hypothetical protein
MTTLNKVGRPKAPDLKVIRESERRKAERILTKGNRVSIRTLLTTYQELSRVAF